MIPKETNILSICSSFRRPHQLPNMLDTFYSTRSLGTEILVYLHADDYSLKDYEALAPRYPWVNWLIGPHRNIQETINYIVFETHPEIPYYQIICDDHLYKTSDWGNIIIKQFEEKTKGWGFACGNDMQNDDWYKWSHPSAEFWSWKMAKTLGYVYPRKMRHQGLDFYTKDLGLAVGLVFVPEVHIRHLYAAGCANPDINILEGYTPANFEYANRMFEEWKINEKPIALQKITAAKEAEKCVS